MVRPRLWRAVIYFEWLGSKENNGVIWRNRGRNREAGRSEKVTVGNSNINHNGMFQSNGVG